MPLSFKPFEAMQPEDYADIGLKCGLEVHRQLLTRTKLFCRCPAGRYSYDYDAEILRHMRPTLSELGEYDGTALMEKKTRKHIHYRIHHDNVCTYEFDDTPPFFLAEDALDAAIELALLLRLNMVDELHIARKQYLDGSIPTGFQRTTILGIDGWIPFQDRRIGVRQLGLEEDSCREVSDIGHDRVYLTDRLGMPLIEVVTEPHMYTPEETAQVARIIRRLCRSTGKVRTGYGAVRQDVNVSVSGGTRIEIKGVPQIGRIPRQIYNEARRQWSLLGIRDELNQRGVTEDRIRGDYKDVTRIVAKTHYDPIHSAVTSGHRVKCIVLPRFSGLLNWPTQENTTFAREFSDRIRVIACLTHLPNMVHSDVASESLHGRDWLKLRKWMKAAHDDALILVWGDEADTKTACEEIAIRAREATIGVPSDTRQAHKDGTNGFERVLPGSERMYPDTDLPPLAIGADRLDRAREALPPYVWETQEKFRKWGLSEDIIGSLTLSSRSSLFQRLVDDVGVKPMLAAIVLTQSMVALRREGLPAEALTGDELTAVFQFHVDGRFSREGIIKVLRFVLAKRAPDEQGTFQPNAAADAKEAVGLAVDALGLTPLEHDEVVRRVSAAVSTLAHDRFTDVDQKHRFVMGCLMRDLLGRVEGAELARLVRDELAALDGQSASVGMRS